MLFIYGESWFILFLIRCVCKDGFKLGNDNITCEPVEDDENEADVRGEIMAEPAYRPKPEMRYNMYKNSSFSCKIIY